MSTYTVAVLLSGSGTNLQAMLDAQDEGRLNARIGLVVSDRSDAYGLQRALQHSIPAAFIPLVRSSGGVQLQTDIRAQWEQRLVTVINAFAPDLIVLAGFMRILSAAFLDACVAPVINQHPALLPDDGGDTVTTSAGLVIPALRGLHVVPEALYRRLPLTGCTVHRVTPTVDDGPVLAVAEVPVLPRDTEATLHERIKVEERRLIVDVVSRLAREARG